MVAVVEVLGAPNTCSVFGYYPSALGPSDSPSTVMLRRDRATWSYPQFCAVDDRPVRLDQHADGTVGARALDLRSGALVRDDARLTRFTGFRDGVDELDPAGFDGSSPRCAALHRTPGR